MSHSESFFGIISSSAFQNYPDFFSWMHFKGLKTQKKQAGHVCGTACIFVCLWNYPDRLIQNQTHPLQTKMNQTKIKLT